VTSLVTSSTMESSLLVVLLAVAAGRCQGNVVATATGGDSFFPEWGLGGGRSAQPTCVDIPRNLTLCYGIRYSKMRLPNLLDHDSMAEVIQQAASWVPLLNVRCHADTQLFLCSLFRSSFAFVHLHRPHRSDYHIHLFLIIIPLFLTFLFCVILINSRIITRLFCSIFNSSFLNKKK